jgi:ubiquinone/menaquinone biosynthesis C-methylase UbiE
MRCAADLGCGIGALLPLLDARLTLGIDHNVEGLRNTRERFPRAALLSADAGALPLNAASLDALTVQHLIEHLADYRRACREWLRVLAPSGVLLVLTPNRRFAAPEVYADETHVHIFEGHELRVELRRAGFEILDARTLGLPWFRNYHRLPAGWRCRQWVTRHAGWLSRCPAWRWRGQTLCVAARRPGP